MPIDCGGYAGWEDDNRKAAAKVADQKKRCGEQAGTKMVRVTDEQGNQYLLPEGAILYARLQPGDENFDKPLGGCFD